MKTYLEKTQELRKISSAENLLIITQRPYNSATKSTISQWIKLALKWAGIDIIKAPQALHNTPPLLGAPKVIL